MISKKSYFRKIKAGHRIQILLQCQIVRVQLQDVKIDVKCRYFTTKLNYYNLLLQPHAEVCLLRLNFNSTLSPESGEALRSRTQKRLAYYQTHPHLKFLRATSKDNVVQMGTKVIRIPEPSTTTACVIEEIRI